MWKSREALFERALYFRIVYTAILLRNNKNNNNNLNKTKYKHLLFCLCWMFGRNAQRRYNNRTLKRADDTQRAACKFLVILFYFIYFLICFYVVAALLSYREVWPEDDCFGSLTAAPEEELMLLRDIFLANLGPGEFIIYILCFVSGYEVPYMYMNIFARYHIKGG